MSAQRLSEKNVRRIERATGLRVTRAWAHGGYAYDFVTPDPSVPERHLHGWYHKVTGEWGLHAPADPADPADPTDPKRPYLHYNTCAQLFPAPTDRSVR